MDLLHSGRFDGFCLVSSDSDFTRLAARIREQGIDVYGFGEQKTPESFRQACRRFIFTENLLPEPSAPGISRGPPAGRPCSRSSAAVPLLRKVIDQMDSEDGWVHLGEVGKRVTNLAPDFDSRTYGHAKLSDLVVKIRLLRRRPAGGPGRAHPPQAAPEGEARPTGGTAGQASAPLRLSHPQNTMTLRSAAPLVTPSIASLIFSSGKRPETSSSSLRRPCR